MKTTFTFIFAILLSLTAYAETITPSGEFAAIDVTASQQAIEALQNKDDRYVEDIISSPGKYAPPVLYALSHALFESGRKDEAMFWFYAGQLRARSDANKSQDISARQAVGVLNARYGPVINKFAFQDLDKLEEIVTKVVEWDKNTERSYDPRWISLHGMDAFTKQHVAFEPKEKWPAIDDLSRTQYLNGFRAAMARTRGKN